MKYLFHSSMIFWGLLDAKYCTKVIFFFFFFFWYQGMEPRVSPFIHSSQVILIVSDIMVIDNFWSISLMIWKLTNICSQSQYSLKYTQKQGYCLHIIHPSLFFTKMFCSNFLKSIVLSCLFKEIIFIQFNYKHLKFERIFTRNDTENLIYHLLF
jgi:hypothetical protein